MTGPTPATQVPPDPLVAGLWALATLVRRGPLETRCLARLIGWQTPYAQAVVRLLEQEGLIAHIGEPARIMATPWAVALVGDPPPSGPLH